jgi:hypothetical protein
VLSAGTRTGTHADGRTLPSCASLSCAPPLLEGATSLLWVSPPARAPVRPCDHSADACLPLRASVCRFACVFARSAARGTSANCRGCPRASVRVPAPAPAPAPPSWVFPVDASPERPLLGALPCGRALLRTPPCGCAPPLADASWRLRATTRGARARTFPEQPWAGGSPAPQFGVLQVLDRFIRRRKG